MSDSSPVALPLIQCWHCGDSAASRVPRGWVTAGLRVGAPMIEPHVYGVCPACVESWYTFRTTDPGCHLTEPREGTA